MNNLIYLVKLTNIKIFSFTSHSPYFFIKKYLIYVIRYFSAVVFKYLLRFLF